jgi:two-component system OmpR family response regulator
MIKLAMIEDDIELAQILIEYLKTKDISITNYEDPFFALSDIRGKDYDLIILDLSLPGMDGLEVCKKLQEYNIPIIISSARSDIDDKISAFEIGAFDYLPKPYDPKELEMRIKTIIKRYNNYSISSKSNIFSLNEEQYIFSKNNKQINFTKAEYEIISLLYKRKGFVVSRYDILENCSHLREEDNGSIAVIISRIRTKLKDNIKKPRYVLTIRGIGYKLTDE